MNIYCDTTFFIGLGPSQPDERALIIAIYRHYKSTNLVRWTR